MRRANLRRARAPPRSRFTLRVQPQRGGVAVLRQRPLAARRHRAGRTRPVRRLGERGHAAGAGRVRRPRGPDARQCLHRRRDAAHRLLVRGLHRLHQRLPLCAPAAAHVCTRPSLKGGALAPRSTRHARRPPVVDFPVHDRLLRERSRVRQHLPRAVQNLQHVCADVPGEHGHWRQAVVVVRRRLVPVRKQHAVSDRVRAGAAVRRAVLRQHERKHQPG